MAVSLAMPTGTGQTNKENASVTAQTVVNMSRGTVSKETYEAVIAWCSYLFIFLSILTLVCSVFNARTLSTKRATFVYYVIGLCVSDFLHAFFRIAYVILTQYCPESSLPARVMLYYVRNYVGISVQRAGVWLNALACCDRLLAVALPFKTRSKGQRSAHGPVILVVTVFVVALFGHLYFLFEIYIVFEGNGSYGYADSRLKLSNPDGFQIAAFFARIVFLYTPLLVIISVNVVMLVFLRKHSKQVQGLRAARGHHKNTDSTHQHPSDLDPKSSRSEAQITKMVLLLTSAFFCVESPVTLNAMLGSLLPHYGSYKQEMYLFRVVGELLMLILYLNQPVLLLLSACYSGQYRRTLRHVICACPERIAARDRTTKGRLDESTSAPSLSKMTSGE